MRSTGRDRNAFIDGELGKGWKSVMEAEKC